MFNRVITYNAPEGAVMRDEYKVKVRTPGSVWQDVSVYEVRVDMHDVRESSMAYFDMEGTVEVAVTLRRRVLKETVIRPLSYAIPWAVEGNTIQFTLDRPRKLSIECNGDRFGNLHLFANPIETDAPDTSDSNVMVLLPGIHRVPNILRRVTATDDNDAVPDVFAPGMHYVEETVMPIPSGMTVYIAGGAVVVGSLVCDHVRDVAIRGRGLLYLAVLLFFPLKGRLDRTTPSSCSFISFFLLLKPRSVATARGTEPNRS